MPFTECRPRGDRESGLSVSLISLYRSPLFYFSSELKIFRPLCPLTHDLFSRAGPAPARNPLSFRHRVSAAQSATSDNGQSVKLGASHGLGDRANSRPP